VQRLPVRILLDPKEVAQHPLQLGLSTEVTVYTRGEKGKTLTTVAQKKPVYSTNTFATQLQYVDQVINKIIHANAPVNVGMVAHG
jgi:membrane fusion protein (multidrug efflux system)